MDKKRDVLSVIISAVIFTLLFHKQSLGLNLLFFETAFLIWLLFTKQIKRKNKTLLTFGTGLLLSAFITVFTHSVFAYVINFLWFFTFIGILIYPNVKSILNAIGLAFVSIFNSQIIFLNELFGIKFKGQKLGNHIWKYSIYIIPLIIIFIFIAIYSLSNPIFDNLVNWIASLFRRNLWAIFKNFDFAILITLFMGLFFANFLFLRTENKDIVDYDLNTDDKLKRLKEGSSDGSSTNSLMNEYKAGVFLLIILNLILLVLNAIDIKWVWFNFEWEGQYLKQFVHEGTYLLILSILISIFIVLFFFRADLNFYRQNKLLKILSYIWLAQNAVLVLSVAIRNYRYINYFALAYKRIGVIIFLILALYGLYTVLVKVKLTKSAFYLFKKNTQALFVVLFICSIFNWDGIIARYNFKKANQSFLHLNYLSTLSDKTLPYLDKSLAELEGIDEFQKEKFPFDDIFMTPQAYVDTIYNRKIAFKEKWESKSILSWNLPEYLAYKKLY